MNQKQWTPATQPPQVQGDDPSTSGPVLVVRRHGKICVARYETWDTDEPKYQWTTDDSEGWRITDEVTHWMPLPEPPEK